MSDAYEHNPGDHEDPMGGPTWLVGFVGVIILIVIVLAVTAVLKFTVTETEDTMQVAPNIDQLNRLHELDQQRLQGEPRQVEYLDVEGNKATRISIPLADAIEITAEQWQRSSPQAAGEQN